MTTPRPIVAVLHGPNLNLLGARQPDIYGHDTLADIDAGLVALGDRLGIAVRTAQHNGEGALVDAIQGAARDGAAGVVINPAAYTHTSVAVRDALVATGLPAVEVHLSNVYAREPFRHTSLVADIVIARIMGFGAAGYGLALRGLASHLGIASSAAG